MPANGRVHVTVAPREFRDRSIELASLPGSVIDHRAEGNPRYLHIFDWGSVGALLESTTRPKLETPGIRIADLFDMSPVVVVKPGEAHEEPFTTAFGMPMILTLSVSAEEEP